MRKPIVVLGLATCASLGTIPVAGAFAATTGATHRPTRPAGSNTSPSYSVPAPPAAPSVSRATNNVSGAALIATALKYLGYPYTATGNSPSTGFSCIGFVSFVYRSNGIALPGDLGNAIAFAQPVPFSNLLPGDILYFQNTVWSGLSHAAIYLGGGKFVHAEYYGKGVRITSFNNDPSDGNYWIQHYLGANRPWTGAAVGPIIAPNAPSSSPIGTNALSAVNPAGPTATAVKVAGGTAALVTVPALYVRPTASRQGAPLQTVVKGNQVVVIGHRKGWYKVQLADGTVGWVIANGISTGATTATAPAPTVGKIVAPTRQGVTASHHAATVTATVNTLRVHSSPSVGSTVVASVSRGQHLQVVTRGDGWVQVRMPDGTTGWIVASYTAKHRPAGASATGSTTAAKVTVVTTGKVAPVSMNVHSGPSLGKGVITVIPAGARYQVMGWSGNWAHVRFGAGGTGWVSGTILGRGVAGSSTNSYAYHRNQQASSHSTAHSATLSMGVRVHTGPGVKSAVVATATAGTRVHVLGHRNGWTLVRLPSGATGYVLGSYVH